VWFKALKTLQFSTTGEKIKLMQFLQAKEHISKFYPIGLHGIPGR
jgi:hypothetical protein